MRPSLVMISIFGLAWSSSVFPSPVTVGKDGNFGFHLKRNPRQAPPPPPVPAPAPPAPVPQLPIPQLPIPQLPIPPLPIPGLPIPPVGPTAPVPPGFTPIPPGTNPPGTLFQTNGILGALLQLLGLGAPNPQNLGLLPQVPQILASVLSLLGANPAFLNGGAPGLGGFPGAELGGLPGLGLGGLPGLGLGGLPGLGLGGLPGIGLGGLPGIGLGGLPGLGLGGLPGAGLGGINPLLLNPALLNPGLVNPGLPCLSPSCGVALPPLPILPSAPVFFDDGGCDSC